MGAPDLYIDEEHTIKTTTDREKADILARNYSKVYTREPAGNVPNLPIKDVPVLSSVEFTETLIG